MDRYIHQSHMQDSMPAFGDEECSKSFSKDGKDGKDDVSAVGGIEYCQDAPISAW